MATLLTYTFTTEDLTAPTIVGVLWLNPRQVRLQFSEAMQADGELGSPTFCRMSVGGMEFVAPNKIRCPGLGATSAWVGYYAHAFGSYHPRNNTARAILAVGVGGELTLDTTEHGEIVSDAGIDYNQLQQIARRRVLRATVSSFRIVARLSSEGAGLEQTDPQTVQCAYEPQVTGCALPAQEDIASGASQERYVIVTFHDDVSINRLYRIDAVRVADTVGNLAMLRQQNTTAPSFGSPVDRFQIWDFLLPAVQDEDMDAQQLVRKMCVVLQDLLNVLWYRIEGLQWLYDAWRIRADMLPWLLHHLGNPFTFPMTSVRLQRRLAERLLGFYRLVGTVHGLEEMLSFFLGLTAHIVPYWPDRAWRLGISTLGVTTYLAPADDWLQNSYEVHVHVAALGTLTDEQLRQISDICNWADAVDMHLARIREITP